MPVAAGSHRRREQRSSYSIDPAARLRAGTEMNVDRRDFLGMIAASVIPRPRSHPFCSSAIRKTCRTSADDLDKAVRALIRDAGAADVAVAFHDLATGDELLIHADVNFHPASTIKVPIMMEVFRQAEEKRLVARRPDCREKRLRQHRRRQPFLASGRGRFRDGPLPSNRRAS